MGGAGKSRGGHTIYKYSDPPEHGGSLFFFIHIHLILDGIADKAVQALSLAGGEVLDDLALAFFDDHVDTVVSFFVVSGGRFFLRVVILWMFQEITSNLY